MLALSITFTCFILLVSTSACRNEVHGSKPLPTAQAVCRELKTSHRELVVYVLDRMYAFQAVGSGISQINLVTNDVEIFSTKRSFNFCNETILNSYN